MPKKAAASQHPVFSPRVSFERVSLRRGGRRVLSGVNWTVGPGEHWFLLGPNGSGKTSLLEIVMGYLWATEGSVRVLGETFGKTFLPELRRKIGFLAPWVLQHIPAWESVLEVTASGAEGYTVMTAGIPAGLRRRAMGWLKFAGCQRYAGAPFRNLSSGEQIRVLLARALTAEPDLLILDEPFSALDPGGRTAVYRFLAALARKPGAPGILMVTHQVEDILPFFTHGLCLRQGKVVFQGTKEKALTSAVLRRTFGMPVHVIRSRGQYHLGVRRRVH